VSKRRLLEVSSVFEGKEGKFVLNQERKDLRIGRIRYCAI